VRAPDPHDSRHCYHFQIKCCFRVCRTAALATRRRARYSPAIARVRRELLGRVEKSVEIDLSGSLDADTTGE
jgi:hypothetical protein